MSAWFTILLVFVMFSVVVVVISENRHPVKTLAWIMVLIFLPVIGLVLYILFGKDNRNRRLISDDKLRLLKSNTSGRFAPDICNDPPEDCKDLIRLLWGVNMAFPLKGNRLVPYTDFDTFFEDMLRDLNSARRHIHFEFFKIEDDPIGRKVEEVLARKVAEGVEVRLQYDDAANLSRKRFYRRMTEKGIKVQPFLKVVIPFISSTTNYRNHRKLVVIDGRIGYTGGMNIAERYSTGIRGGIWRDTHLRIEGPAVSEMQTCFLVDWQFSTKEFISSGQYYPDADNGGESIVQIATSGPMDEWRVIMQGILQMIAQSRNYIYIQSPYLIPTEPVLMAIRNAALSGVDVRIMIPYRGDKGVVVPLASRSYVKDVVAAGARVFFYENGYMHSKAIVSDDRIVTIGSTNMDIRSYEQDFEINAFIYDEQLAVHMKQVFLDDMQYTWEVNPDEWAARPRSRRFAESLARLASPLL